MKIFNRTFVSLWTLDIILMVATAFGLNAVLSHFGVATALPISITTLIVGLLVYVYLVVKVLKRWGYIGNHNHHIEDECFDDESCEDDYEETPNCTCAHHNVDEQQEHESDTQPPKQENPV
jgi:hypothetical protein